LIKLNKKFFILKDLMLNIIGMFFVTGILQLVVYPFLSRQVEPSNFGTILTVIGIGNALAVIFGSSLTNVKLLTQNEYVNELKFKDFKALVLKSILLIVPIMTAVSILYSKQSSVIGIILVNVITILIMLRAYMVSYYRIELNYKLILYHLIITGLGYLFGILLYSVVKYWEVVFLSGEITAFIFAYKTTKYKNEEYKTSQLYKKTQNEYIQLIASSAITNVMVYIDRILINPILGAASVAIFFIASLMGKTLGLVLQPLASIILTYISKDLKIDKKKLFMYYSIVITVSGIFLYILSIVFTPTLIKLLYPQSFNDVKDYLNIANLGAIISILGSLIQPFLLKYCPLWWQPTIEILYGTIYILGGIVLMSFMQLYGFCLISVIANLIRLLGLLLVGIYYIYDLKKLKSYN
jgi:O-antigen/teichoic acid export membrane protein